MPVTRLAPTIERVEAWAPVVVFAGLPTVGMVAGPSYSSMVIGLAVVWLLAGWGAGRGMPSIDRSFAALAGVFLILCWASVAWSIAPRDSVRSALGLTGVLVALLVVCARRHDRPGVTEAVFRVLLIATVVGVAVACLDMALGYPLQMSISTKPGVSAATKYNRGFDYLVLLVWPLLAHVWWRRRWWAVCILGLTIAVILAVTLSLAARVAVAAGLLVLVVAWIAPRLAAIALDWATVAYGLVLPLALRLLAARRDELAPLLKASGVHRLEIWDYMTARVLERPVLGWGLLSAKSLPIHPDELAHYVYVRPAGVYPHNQFLELWVELGALGAVVGVVFAVLVLRRVRRLPTGIRPFAYAAFASAMTVASVDYEIVTDSWWCALAASAVLFGMLGHLVTDARGHDRTA
jgi:O-antigen ligase